MTQPQHNPWTSADIAQLRYYARLGLSMVQIGVKLNRSKHSITRKVHDLGIPLVRPTRSHHIPKPGEAHEKGDGIRAGKITLPPLPSLQHDD